MKRSSSPSSLSLLSRTLVQSIMMSAIIVGGIIASSAHLASTVLIEHPQSEIHLDVQQLVAVADFHSVRLSWKYAPLQSSDHVDLGGQSSSSSRAQTPIAFVVKQCELVTWGKDKCVSRVLNSTATTSESIVNPDDQKQLSNDVNVVVVDADGDSGADRGSAAADRENMNTYQTTVSGLRLATNYSFEVHPLIANARSLDVHDVDANSDELVVSTKAFSAHPRTCLGDRTEVDIETGPNFGGHVSVEGAYDRRCSWIGDERDLSTVHTFVIDHHICGGGLKEGRIETIVIVSESRTIITHTARRFMVVCNLVPETYTIKASINVPNNGNSNRGNEETHSSNQLQLTRDNDVDSAPGHLSYEEIFQSGKLNPSNNRRISAEHTAELRQMAQLLEGNRNDTTAAHLILMVAVVVAVSLGTVATVWWFIAQRTRAGHFDIADAEYDERLSPCRNVVVMPGNKMSSSAAIEQGASISAGNHLEQDFDSQEIHEDQSRERTVTIGVINWGSMSSSQSQPSFGSRIGIQLGMKPDCINSSLSSSSSSSSSSITTTTSQLDNVADFDSTCAATTLVLAPSITAAFQSSGCDSCC